MLVVFPAAESLMVVWPVRLGGAPWRYGAAGLLSRSFLTPILGLTILLVAADWFRDRFVLRIVGVTGGLAAIFLLLVAITFAFDSATLREVAAAESGGPVPFNGSAIVAGAKLVLGSVAAAAIARSAWVGSSTTT